MKPQTAIHRIVSAAAICLLLGPLTAQAGDISADAIRNAAMQEARSLFDVEYADYEMSVMSASAITMPEEPTLSLRTSTPHDKVMNGRVTVQVDVLNAQGKTIATRYIPVKADEYGIVAVAATEIERGEPLSGSAVELKRVEITRIDEPLTTHEALKGREAKRRIRAGSVIKGRDTQVIPLVHRGETVTIETQIGNVSARVQGIAREDGGAGETIRVFNEIMRKTLECTVVDEGRVVAGL